MIRQAPATKTYDVVHLGNLCLDIIVQVDALPPIDPGAGRNPRFRPCCLMSALKIDGQVLECDCSPLLHTSGMAP